MVSLGDLPFTIEPELDSLGNKLHSQGLISTNANNYVQQIFTLALTYLNVNVPTVALHNSFASKLITIEGQIKSDNTISANEKTTLLASCSIGRYSAAYWGNYINNPVESKINPPKLRLAPWLKILLGDIGGGIIGITMGPVGILTGAIGTSIVTAATL
jgi:hypothetical protein